MRFPREAKSKTTEVKNAQYFGTPVTSKQKCGTAFGVQLWLDDFLMADDLDHPELLRELLATKMKFWISKLKTIQAERLDCDSLIYRKQIDNYLVSRLE